MEVISVITGLIFFWTTSLIIISVSNNASFKRKKKNLIGRVVQLSSKLLSESDYKSFGKYARIIEVFGNEKIHKITSLIVQGTPNKEYLLIAKNVYDKKYQSRAESYKQMQRERGKNWCMAFLSTPVYDASSFFDPNNFQINVNCKEVKLMPKNFDITSETIMKPLNPVVKGGENKKMKRMPRIFRFALYLALIVLVWDVVINANNIVMFAVHTFILNK